MKNIVWLYILLTNVNNIHCENIQQCYRKLGLYNFYDSSIGKQTTFNVNTPPKNFDNVVEANAKLLEKKINWTSIKEDIDKLFVYNCTNDTKIYNGIIKEYLTIDIGYGFFNINTSTNISRDSLDYKDIVISETNITDINGTTNATNVTNMTYNDNATTDNYINITMENSSTIISFSNITIMLNNTCTISIYSIEVTLTPTKLVINATSDPFSTSPPFMEKESIYNCSIITPLYINQTYPMDRLFTTTVSPITTDFTTMYNTTTNTTTMYNTTPSQYNDSYNKTICIYSNGTIFNVTILQKDNIFTNMSQYRDFINSCETSSIETKAYAVGVTNMFNEVLTNMSIGINNDTDDYFHCKIKNHTSCGIGIFISVAITNSYNEHIHNTSHTRHARSVSDMTTVDSFCEHANYGMNERRVDCTTPSVNTFLASMNTNKRMRRSPPKQYKQPVNPTGDLPLMSASELGARPKIRARIQKIQLGSRGIDGTVSGSEEIYEQVKNDLRSSLQSILIKDGKLTDGSLLPPKTKALIGSIIKSKHQSSSESIRISKDIISSHSDDQIYVSTTNKHKFSLESKLPKYSTYINTDTSSRIYVNAINSDVKIKIPENVDVYETSPKYYKIKQTPSNGHDDVLYFKDVGKSNSYYKIKQTPSNGHDDVLYFKDVGKSNSYYKIKQTPSNGHDDVLYFKDVSPTYVNNPLRTMSDPSNNIYEEIGEGPYSLLNYPKNDRSNIPLPKLPDSSKQRKVIDMICESRSSSICNVKSLESEYKHNPLYYSRDTAPIYEDIDDLKPLTRENPIYASIDKYQKPLTRENPIYASTDDEPTLKRKNAMRRRKLNNNGQDFIQFSNNNNNNNNNDNNDNDNDNEIVYTEVRKTKKKSGVENTIKIDNKMNKLVQTIAISSYLSTSNARISSIMSQSSSQPKELTLVNIVSNVLSQIGGTMAMTGSPKAAIAGLALQGISGLIDAATSIYFLLSGEEQPKDPAIEKFSNYASYMSMTEAGARVCMMPDSDITITLAYRHTKMNTDAEKTNGEYTDVIPSKVYYLKNNQISYTVKVKLVCPIGQLRLFEADVNTYASLIREDKNGVKFYHVHGILELLSYHPNVTFTCGNEPGVIFMPFEQSLSDMQLLRISTPGEPKEAEEMYSNVCDVYPLKKFYVLAGNCPFDMSRKSVAYVTCSTLLRMSTYEHERNRWILMNPFSRGSEDNIQLFTFKKYDFSSENDRINLNEIGHGDSICSQSDSSTCYWADPMILEDVTSCNTRIRKLSVSMATISGKGYNNFVLTCPYGSTPFYISNITIIDIPMNTRRTSVRFASYHKGVALVSCIHNSNPMYKSDIVEIFFDTYNVNDSYLDFDHFEHRKKLFDSFSDIMPKRSKTCKRISENTNCKNYYHIKNIPEIEYNVKVIKLPLVRLGIGYTGTLDDYILERIDTYFTTPINIKIDMSTLSNVYKFPEHFWKFASQKKRTFSSIAVTMFACSIVAGNINVNTGILSRNIDRYGRNGKYVYVGSKDVVGDDRIHFNFIKDKDDDKLMYPYGKCDIYLDLKSRDLHINCPEFTIPRHPFNNDNINGLCVLVATSRDHCAITEERWSKYDRSHSYGYSYEEAQTEFDSCKNTGSSKPTDNFCYYWYASTYWPPDYDPCASSMVLGYSNIFAENRIVNPPYIKEFGYDTSKNEYVNRDLYNKLQILYDKYNSLIMYSMDPVVEMSNELAKSISKEGREIFRLILNSEEMRKTREENKIKADKVREDIEETLKDIYVNTLSYTEATELLRSAINTRCCVLNGTVVYKYFPYEYYLCGNYSDYIIHINNVSYVKINNTVIEEDIYLARNIPQITCFKVNILSIDNEENQRKFESQIVKTALEDAISDIFEDYDKNITDNFRLYIENIRYKNRSKNTINDVLIITTIITFIITILALVYSILVLIIKRRKGKYKVNKKIDTISLDTEENIYVSLTSLYKDDINKKV
ncbi:SPV131 VAR B22R homologue [Swinepox virus]|nr:SPV131 VAR B22R homologue [Swinepox virus]